ncbi:hypothetical protein TVAG_059700 [Trichomonas vaginalis G3]|uniref:Uncharacterized protein n=1 Tax=Trichomonas vaginalis (strain ATCC PRA-98 / G3) TaxID=412133 RepID=A2FB22_TRIV3|nr:hypothetical protein TVAG_059700 [Trichomonas vaginalis G3]|eukprot:XP_001310835.1 hypothetical protein [Trichomonas vaginalis G3]
MGKPPPANENEENSSPQNSDIQSLIDNMIKTPLSPENEIKFKILLNTCSYTDLNEALSSILASLIQSFHEKANLKQGSDYKFFILKPLSEIRYSIDESLMTDDNMKTINSIVPKLSFDSLYYLSLILKNTIISPNLKQSKPLQKFMDVYYDSIDRLCKFYIDEFKDKNYKKLHMLIPIFDSFINTASYDIPLKFTAKGNFSKIIQSILSIDLDPDVFRTYKTFLSLKIKSYRLLSYDPTIIDTNLNDLLIDASKLALKIVSPLLDKLNELQTVLILIITKISEKKEESTEIMQSALSQIYSLFNHSPQYRIFAIKILDQICQQFPDIFKDSSTYVHCINKFIQDPVINPMKRFNILENLIDAIQFTNDNDYVAHMSFIQVSIGSLMKKYFNNLKNFVDQKTIENHKEIYELSEDMYHAMIIYEKIVVPEKQVSIILDESFKSAREIMDVYEYNLRFITLYQTYINFFSNFTKDSVIPNNFDDQAKLVLILSELQKQCDNLVKILPILYKNMPKPIIEDIFTNYFNNCFDEGLFTLIKFGYMENRDLFGEIFRVLIVESSERILKNNNVRKQLIFIRNWVNYVIEWQQTINTKIVANDVDYIMYACVITISNHTYFEDSLKTLLSIFSFLTIFQIKNSFLPVPTNVRDILTASVNYDIFIPELTDFLNHAFKAEPKYLCDQMICSFLIQALPKCLNKYCQF